ncbi:MAG: ankyrin repeat domain-containing protein, partial [Acetobacteraceae bacterium]
MRPERLLLPALATVLATILASTAIPAAAQTPNLLNPGPVVRTPARAAPPVPPPPGLPGAVHNGGTPAPPSPSESGLSPTAALFDAINRGDLGAAREAIGRGAQLDAKNVLGMTPLELAVDLDRNDIAFLLLSIEHEGRAAASSAGASLALSVPPAAAASSASRA